MLAIQSYSYVALLAYSRIHYCVYKVKSKTSQNPYWAGMYIVLFQCY